MEGGGASLPSSSASDTEGDAVKENGDTKATSSTASSAAGEGGQNFVRLDGASGVKAGAAGGDEGEGEEAGGQEGQEGYESDESESPSFWVDAGVESFIAGFSVALAALLVALLIPPKWAGHRSPVIIVPGLGGSQIEARLEHKNFPMSFSRMLCSRDSRQSWFALWLNLEPFVTPGRFDCWADNARLEWDFLTHSPRMPEGVSVRIPGWGSTETIERVDANADKLDWLKNATLSKRVGLNEYIAYLSPIHEMVERFVQELGYTRGEVCCVPTTRPPASLSPSFTCMPPDSCHSVLSPPSSPTLACSHVSPSLSLRVLSPSRATLRPPFCFPGPSCRALRLSPRPRHKPGLGSRHEAAGGANEGREPRPTCDHYLPLPRGAIHLVSLGLLAWQCKRLAGPASGRAGKRSDSFRGKWINFIANYPRNIHSPHVVDVCTPPCIHASMLDSQELSPSAD